MPHQVSSVIYKSVKLMLSISKLACWNGSHTSHWTISKDDSLWLLPWAMKGNLKYFTKKNYVYMSQVKWILWVIDMDVYYIKYSIGYLIIIMAELFAIKLHKLCATKTYDSISCILGRCISTACSRCL